MKNAFFSIFIFFGLGFFAAIFLAGDVQAEQKRQAAAPQQMARVALIPGWRQSDGSHMAGIEIALTPGWKTYWRSPGDAGLPPLLHFDNSENLASAQVVWPAPKIFHSNGARIVGYEGTVVWPLKVTPIDPDKPIDLHLALDLGVCSDVCVPLAANVTGTLSTNGTRAPSLVGALHSAPARTGTAACKFAPMQDGLAVTVQFELPFRASDLVIETASPTAWVSEPDLDGSFARALIKPAPGSVLSVARNDMTLTAFGDGQVAQIDGC